MRRLGSGLFLLAISVPVAPALAQDFDEDEDVIFDELPGEQERAPAPRPAPVEPEPVDDEPEPDDLLHLDDEPSDNLFEDEEEGPEPQVPGSDTTQIYRAQLRAVEGLPPDEEVMAWEAYLERYPNSLFRSGIEQRIDELVSRGFEQVHARRREATGDAANRELFFVQPIHLPNVNPRSRALVDLEIGFGADTVYTGGNLDFEWAFLRNLSVHGGADGTYTGWGINAGVRYAFVKSVRDQLVATLIGDVRVAFPQPTGNLDGSSAGFQFRPGLGFGKIAGPAQILLTAGAEIGSRRHETAALRAGLLVDVRLGPPVSVFLESDVYLRDLTHTDLDGRGSPYAFQVVTVGLRFFPKLKNVSYEDPLTFAAAGNVGVVSNYVQPYLGAVHLQGAYYLPPR